MARSKCFIIYQPDKTRTDVPEYDEDRYDLLGEIARRRRNDFMVRFEIYKSKDSSDKGYYCKGVADDTCLMQTRDIDNEGEMKDLAHEAVSLCFGKRNNPNDEGSFQALCKDLRKKLLDWLRELKPEGYFHNENGKLLLPFAEVGAAEVELR